MTKIIFGLLSSLAGPPVPMLLLRMQNIKTKHNRCRSISALQLSEVFLRAGVAPIIAIETQNHRVVNIQLKTVRFLLRAHGTMTRPVSLSQHKVTGFLEIDRHDRKYAPVEERIKHWHEFVLPLPEKESPRPGRALHGLRRALLPRHQPAHRRADRLPGQQPDPGLERSGLPRQLGRGRAQPALDQ